jgi:RHS repeat-associated protein
MNAEQGGRDAGAATARSEKSAVPSISLPKGGGALRGISEKFAANPVTGSGSLSVPLPTSPGRSGFGPQLTLSYDSGAGNGPFGLGWNLSLPAITRKTDKGLPRYHEGGNAGPQADEARARGHEMQGSADRQAPLAPRERGRGEGAADCAEPATGDSDVFILSGFEDLVPEFDATGRLFQDSTTAPGYTIRRYRPRIEGLFSRIERWSRDDGEVHWRSISRDNVLTLYGFDPGSRIADPQHPERVFSWLICRSYDDKGNALVYDYAAEDDAGVDTARPSERNRVRSANRYPKRIRYGNRVPLLCDPERPAWRRGHCEPHDIESAGWMFEVVFDYGEGHYREEPPDREGRTFALAGTAPERDWQVRRDPFSSYRSAFEIRSYRLCRRVLMFHHFPQELGAESCLVRSTAFDYREKPTGSFMTRVVQSGHKLREDGRYLTRSLPPLELTYSANPLEDPEFADFPLHKVDPQSLANLPGGVGGDSYSWVDLDGEGISGVLARQEDLWFYKPNLGNARLGAAETVRSLPSLAALGGAAPLFMDLAGDGNLDLVDLSPQAAGFQERTPASGWEGFRTFSSLPVRDWNDPNLRFVDLSGDGIADVLVTGDDALTWHPSLLREGFGPGLRIKVPVEEEQGPRVVFADAEQSVYLADMTGDGLSDLLRVRNGEICYWPNLGYGRFGARITMENAPRLDLPDLFDQGRLRLADTDGSGTSDVIYLGADGVRVYLNQSGNGWSAARELRRLPALDDQSSVTVADFLGRGTACLVWSSQLPREAGRQLRYLDLMCGEKPHLLKRVVNNLGAETRIEYTTSTEFYLADKAAGTPWVTRLPFPVQVVKRVETFDFVSRNRFVSSYSYHHGFYDGVEREFRGFGRVDQLDTEEIAALSSAADFPAGGNFDHAHSVPPVLTKTWFHTGVYPRGELVSRHLAHEYYLEGAGGEGERLTRAQLQAMLLDDTVLPRGLTPEEAREACRSLKGAVLRQEVYGLDDSEASPRPYTVTESNYTIRTLQQRHGNRHAVFFTHARESLTFNYERTLYRIDGCRRVDPRVSHGVTLEVDDYGNVRKSLAIGYGRRFPDPSPLLSDPDRKKQSRIMVTLAENDYTNAVTGPDAYRTPLPAESRLYELVNLVPAAHCPGQSTIFRIPELAAAVAGAGAGDGRHDLPSEDWQSAGATEPAPYRRLLKQSRNLYRSNRLDRLLPQGSLESLALPGESYHLAFTASLLAATYGPNDRYPGGLLPDPAAVLGSRGADGGGYLDLDGDGRWWVPTGRVFFHVDPDAGPAAELEQAARHFFLPRRARDPFGFDSTVDFDRYDLLTVRTRDALGSTVSAGNDYRVLRPVLVSDPNGNRSRVSFDTLGLVAGSAVMGKHSETLGDLIDDSFQPDPTRAQVDAFMARPRSATDAGGSVATPIVHELLAGASTRIVYDPDRFQRLGEPSFAAVISRETHLSDLAPAQTPSRLQISFSFFDGFGREIQKKAQAEPGPVSEGGPIVNPRWVGSGWTVFNNKGKPVRQYEPFFDERHDFRFGVQTGVSPVLFYDPVGRNVATLYPNHSYQKTVFDPWRQLSYDVNDTVTCDPRADGDVKSFFLRLPQADYLPTWYGLRADPESAAQAQAQWPDPKIRAAEADAARKAAKHAGTPALAHFDSLGRPFLSIVQNRFDRRQPDDSIVSVQENYATRVELDIEANQHELRDARGRLVQRYDYDIIGTRIHKASMEAGERWGLGDVVGKPIRAWDSRRHQFRSAYDPLRRPSASYLREAAGPERQIARTLYGESRPDAEEENLRGKAVQLCDQGGVVSFERFDFKGNLLASRRQLAREYQATLDWSADPELEPEIFSSATGYDALNRPVSATAPDGSVHRPGFNEAGLLESMALQLRGAGEAIPFVTNIDYNSRGQRILVDYGNQVRTQYRYDPLTFRLARLKTTRPGDHAPVQDLNYALDPIGNVTRIEDRARQTVYFSNQVVTPDNDYRYDAAYRLISARGREHIGQLSEPETTWNDEFRVKLQHPQNGHAMRGYLERYQYDEVGNFRQLSHHAAQGNWTRSYRSHEASQLEPDQTSNRLSSTAVHPDGSRPVHEMYSHDAHGNMTAMPHLALMQWDFNDHLQATSRQAVNDGAPETTYYVYDGSGERLRKVTERQNGTRKCEWRYLGGYELYREYDAAGLATDLQREIVQVMDNKQRVALVETRTQGSDAPAAQLFRYQYSNHIGSATLELDEAGQIICYEEYYPYGSTSYQAGTSAVEVSLKRYRFTGMERDDETGLNYHSARYYAPWLGRWASCDPTGPSDGSNLYQYARSSPTRFNDPGGRESLDAAIYTGSDILGSTLKQVGQAAHLPMVEAMGDTVLQIPRAIERQYGRAMAGILQMPGTPVVTVNGKAAVMPADLLKVTPEELMMNVLYQGALGALPVLQRTVSAMSAVGHAMEAVGGAALCTTVVGCVIGGAAVAHGLDNYYSDVKYTITGETRTPATVRGLQYLGFSNSTSSNINTGLGFGLSAATSIGNMCRVGDELAFEGVGGGGGGGGFGGGGGGGGGPNVNIVSPVFREGAHDVIVVETSLGRQGFYRSTGNNSGMPGAWLPFDEMGANVNKWGYTEMAGFQEGEPLFRFGNQEFRDISNELGNMDIPVGAPVQSGEHMNDILDFFGACITPYNINRPTDMLTR